MTKNRTRVTVFVPILSPSSLEPHDRPNVEATAQEVANLSGVNINADESSTRSSLRMSLHDLPPKDLTKSDLPEDNHFSRSYRRTRRFRDWKLLRLEVNVELLRVPRWTKEGGEEVSEDESRELSLSTFVEEVEKLIYHLTIAANIAAPGQFEIGGGSAYQNGLLVHRTDSWISDLSFASEYSAVHGWPQLRRLPIQSVWAWLQVGGYLDGFGESPMGRAINAFSYCFSRPGASDPTQLFWALMGVEALFGHDAPGVRSVVIERCQLLLGRYKPFRREFAELYKTRSAFVHGGLPFPGSFNLYDGTAQAEKFGERLDRARILAEVVLLASLQEMASRGWHTLSFQLYLDGK